jgi:FkbM family methyltransferase
VAPARHGPLKGTRRRADQEAMALVNASPAPVAPDAAQTTAPSAEPLDAAARAERRARFLQVVTDSLSVHLADNIDYLFDPWGPQLPASDTFGARLADQLRVLEEADVLWAALGDEDSRELLLRFSAYRALGPAHVRLQLDPVAYRQTVIGLNRALRTALVVAVQGMPMEWQLHHYDLTPHGMPIQIIGPPLPLASTLAFSQYAYRDEAVPARPRLGDVALDVGGCWGDTALWLAHAVGESGMVHTFEPSARNRAVLEHNLGLNPHLASRIAVWSEPVGPRPGETVWIPDMMAAGTAIHTAPDDSQPMLELQTESIDDLVGRRIVRVDFLKIDVEGADLGVLDGAAETIRMQRPRLAIACYHRPDDLVTIPAFIAGLGVSYRWYLQCSTMTDVDTVAFGVPN